MENDNDETYETPCCHCGLRPATANIFTLCWDCYHWFEAEAEIERRAVEHVPLDE
jgi:hypothetical protein